MTGAEPPQALFIEGGGESSPALAELSPGAAPQPGDFVRWGEQTWRVVRVLDGAPGPMAGGPQVEAERLG